LQQSSTADEDNTGAAALLCGKERQSEFNRDDWLCQNKFPPETKTHPKTGRDSNIRQVSVRRSGLFCTAGLEIFANADTIRMQHKDNHCIERYL